MVCVGQLLPSGDNYANDTSTPCGKLQKIHDISFVAGGTQRKICFVEANPTSICVPFFPPDILFAHSHTEWPPVTLCIQYYWSFSYRITNRASHFQNNNLKIKYTVYYVHMNH